MTPRPDTAAPTRLRTPLVVGSLEFLAGLYVFIERATLAASLLALLLASYARWGSEGSPLGLLERPALVGVGVWVVLALLEPRVLRLVRRLEFQRRPRPTAADPADAGGGD